MSTPNIKNSTNTCYSIAYLNLLQQRKRLQLFNVPPPRYNNLEKNPYTKINPTTGLFFTNFDLSMRRKAEVLKYSNNTSSTKTNNLTKRQKWSQLVNGNSSTYSQAYINSNPTPCPDVIVYTPSSASGVPGPSVLLYEDANVPIYNLLNNVRTAPYGVENSPANTLPWQSYPRANALSSQTNSSIFSIFNTLNMQNVEVNSQYSYSMSIPFTIYVEADAKTDLTYIGHFRDLSAVQLYVSTISLAVFYSDSVIKSISDVSYSLSDVFYTSDNTAMNIAADVSINIHSTDPTFNKFYAYSYGGVFNISNVVLQAQPGYIYDMQLAVNYTFKTSNTFSTFFQGNGIPSIYFAYLNTSYATTQLASLNCHVTNPAQVSPTNFPKFTIVGNSI